MPRILLLCFIHGFKGTDDTFHAFPDDLKRIVTQKLPDHRVESVVYPKYETKGELAQATEAFLSWLKERVIEIRKAHLDQQWPPNDRNVGVILVGHSMGGFVAADTLFLALNEKEKDENEEKKPLFPLIQGILTFDTPFNGLARSMFVYGAFSNYQKVSNVFNAMTAIAAAAPASLGRLGARRAAASAVSSSAGSNQAWKKWQLIAVKTGTVGAIAAGGVAAYMHRESIMRGMRGVKNLNKESVVSGYRQGVDSIGQGLAYINRGNVGRSFEWLSDHFTYVGALMKPKELSRRLERMAALQGVGLRDYYASLGENGYWSGGYFVPERTFCAVPASDRPANKLFSRCVLANVEDEVQAHLSMFIPEKNEGYEQMTEQAADMVVRWFLDESDAVDDPQFREAPAQDASEEKTIQAALEQQDVSTESVAQSDRSTLEKEGDADTELPDESPIDIAAAASLVPLPDDRGDEVIGNVGSEAADGDSAVSPDEKNTYLQHLFRVAQQTGTELRGMLPSKFPSMPSMPAAPSVKQVNIPSIFSKKSTSETAREENKKDD